MKGEPRERMGSGREACRGRLEAAGQWDLSQVKASCHVKKASASLESQLAKLRKLNRCQLARDVRVHLT